MSPTSQSQGLAFAGGTWNGYAPLQEAADNRQHSSYALWLGLSDDERIGLLKAHKVSGVLITPQALAESQNALAGVDPVVIHVFSRMASAAGAEHVLVKLGAGAENNWSWALPPRKHGDRYTASD